jgi:hypothetical protein
MLLVGFAQFPAQGQGKSNGQGNQDDREEVAIGLAIAPVTLDFERKDRTLVGLGSYYVNGISDCVGCHTGETGHLGGGVPFGNPTDPNTPVSRNLTPDSTGKPAGLTFAQFKAVLRQGIDFKELLPDTGDPDLLVVMPWPAYRHGTDRFVEALYEYLKSIPCLEGGPGQPANRCD